MLLSDDVAWSNDIRLRKVSGKCKYLPFEQLTSLPFAVLLNYAKVVYLYANLYSVTPSYELCHEKTFFHMQNKGPDQRRLSRAADQCLCFRYKDSTILLPKSKISSLLVVMQLGLCPTWSETLKTGYLATGLICMEDIELKDYMCLSDDSSFNMYTWYHKVP